MILDYSVCESRLHKNAFFVPCTVILLNNQYTFRLYIQDTFFKRFNVVKQSLRNNYILKFEVTRNEHFFLSSCNKNSGVASVIGGSASSASIVFYMKSFKLSLMNRKARRQQQQLDDDDGCWTQVEAFLSAQFG